MHDFSVFIGRFQPFHNGHLANIKYGLSIAKRLIIMIGSYKLAPSPIDPWTALERKNMILSSLTKAERKRVQFVFIRDRLYHEELWKENVTKEVQLIAPEHSNIVIIGYAKDESSYYLKIFPQWTFTETKPIAHISGTDFRHKYFFNKTPSYSSVPNAVAKILKTFKKQKLFKILKEEYIFSLNQKITTHKKFVFLLLGSYLLLIKRNHLPGKNLYSLPILETITLDDKYTQYCNRKKFYSAKYDAINLNGKEVIFYRIPKDVSFDMKKFENAKCKWFLLDEFFLMENKIFQDHYQIIRNLIHLL